MRRLTLAVAPILVAASAAMASAVAVIDLARDPEPPSCVDNPGGSVAIVWQIRASTSPSFVRYQLMDTTRTAILDSETYPGATGLDVARGWTVPRGTPSGKYWIRVEFWSAEAGNEANSEVAFFICDETGPTPTAPSSWGRLKSTYR